MPEADPEWPQEVKEAVLVIHDKWLLNTLTVEYIKKEIYGGDGNDFSTDFAWCLGVPPKAYINDLRVEAGKKILIEKRFREVRIYTIAKALGYSGKGAFSHAFKQREGLSPGEWRTRQLSGKG